MIKTRTAFASTSRHHEKSGALNALRAQIDQRIHEPSTPPSVSSGTLPGSTQGQASSNIVNNLTESPVYYTVDGVVLFDDEGNRWGEIVNEVPVGDASFLTAIRINAILSRVDSNTFLLPSRAQYVTDVWFDHLKAEPTNHYNFFPKVTVVTVSSIGIDVVVSALYINEAV